MERLTSLILVLLLIAALPISKIFPGFLDKYVDIR